MCYFTKSFKLKFFMLLLSKELHCFSYSTIMHMPKNHFLSILEGLGVDTIFFPPSICVPNPKNPKNIDFSSRDHGNI